MKRSMWLVGMMIAVAMCGCSKKAPMKVGDTVCIGSRFLIVGDMETYPWVKMAINARCADHANDPDAVFNMERVDSFNPSCVCRYSAACRKQCTERAVGANAYFSAEACLESCEKTGTDK